MELTQGLCHELFEYCDGDLYWKSRTANSVQIGKKVGSLNKAGYLRTTINGKGYRLHRIIFLMHNGYLPSEVDHINGIRTDNRIENLRAATRIENARNAKLCIKNISGHKNVCWNSQVGKWQVGLRVNGKSIHIGIYDDLDLAATAAEEAREKYHGEFANHG